MTIHHRPPPRIGPTDDRPRRPVLLQWSEADGTAWREVWALPDTPALEAATAIAARGTLLRGPDGLVAVEDVGPGDMVATLDGWARVVWTGARAPRPDAAGPPLLRVAPHAFGPVPARTLFLGRAALVLLDDPRCRRLVGQARALAPLAALGRAHDVTPIAPPGEVATHGLAVMGQAALDLAGLPVASAHPAQSAAAALHARAARDLADAFPFIAGGRAFDVARVPCLTPTEAATLAEAGPVGVAWIGTSGG